MGIDISEQIIVPIDQIRPSPRNPRKMTDTKFNYLVQNITENGFNDPILVDRGVWEYGKLVDEDKFYEVVDGNHRLRAAKIVGLTEVPVLVFPKRLTQLQRDYMGVRYNSLHNASFQTDTFTSIVNDLLKEFDDRQEVISLFMQDRDEFERYYKEVREGLPDEIKEKLPKTGEEIKTIDDLARILNNLFNEYGDTLEYNFMIFAFGKEKHLYIQCDKELWKIVNEVTSLAESNKQDVNILFKQIFAQGWNGGDKND